MKNLKWVLCGGCVCVFLVLCAFVMKYDVLSIDSNVYNFIARHFMNDTMTSVAKMFTFMGSAVGLIAIALILLVVIKPRKIGLYIFGNLASVTIVNQIVKHIIRRPRPAVIHLVEEGGYSFPSGHSMVSFAFYAFLIYLIYKNIENKYLKYSLIVILCLLIPMIGLSRIYLGVHYFTDVIGGFVLALAYLIVFITIYNKGGQSHEK